MDIQLKRGLLDICVLSAIKNEDSYGYSIIKKIKPYVEISESTLYPILRRLESAQMLTVKSVEHNGRLRKYYSITPLGTERIEEFKSEWQEIMSVYRHNFLPFTLEFLNALRSERCDTVILSQPAVVLHAFYGQHLRRFKPP